MPTEPLSDEFGGVAVEEPQSQDVDEFGGLSLESLARTAVQTPLRATGETQRLFRLAAPGADMARAQTERSAAEEAAQRQRQFIAGGGPGAGMAFIPPAPVGEAIRMGEQGLVDTANALYRLPQEALGLKERPIFGETPEEHAQRQEGPLVLGKPLYEPQTATPSDVQKIVSGFTTPESILTLPLAETRTGARILLATMLPGVAQQVNEIATGGGTNETKMDQIRSLVVPAIIGLMASKPEGVRFLDTTFARERVPTGRQLPMREGAPLPPQPPPVPTEPVPPRTAFPPGPAPTTPVPPREAFPPGPAPSTPVPPREAFPPGPAPKYPPNQQWAYRPDLPPGPAPREAVPPRPPEPAAPAAEVPAVDNFREAAKIPGLEFQSWLEKHGGDLTKPTNAAYAMSEAIKTDADLAEVQAAHEATRKEVEEFKQLARKAMAENPQEGIKLLNQSAAFVSKLQYFDEAGRMYKARKAVAGGMSLAQAAKDFGVSEKFLAKTVKPSAAPPPTPTKPTGLPSWVAEEMKRRGLKTGRIFNDVDLSNPSIREAIQSDPTLTDAQKQQLLATGSMEPTTPTTPEPMWMDKPLSFWEGKANAKDLTPAERRAIAQFTKAGTVNEPAKLFAAMKKRVAEIRAKPPTPPMTEAAEETTQQLPVSASQPITPAQAREMSTEEVLRRLAIMVEFLKAKRAKGEPFEENTLRLNVSSLYQVARARRLTGRTRFIEQYLGLTHDPATGLPTGVQQVSAPPPPTETTPVPTLFVRQGNRLAQVTPEQVSKLYDKMRQESGAGASELPPLDLFDSNGNKIGRVSYNGRVWIGEGKNEKAIYSPGEKTKPVAPPAETKPAVVKLSPQKAGAVLRKIPREDIQALLANAPEDWELSEDGTRIVGYADSRAGGPGTGGKSGATTDFINWLMSDEATANIDPKGAADLLATIQRARETISGKPATPTPVPETKAPVAETPVDVPSLIDKAMNIVRTKELRPKERLQLAAAIETARKGNPKPLTDLNEKLSALPDKPKKQRVGRGVPGLTRFNRETEASGPDILSWMVDNMKLLSRSMARKVWTNEKYSLNKSLWDDAPSSLAGGPHHNIIYGPKGYAPDRVAQAAFEDGALKEPSVNALWQAIGAASAKRKGSIEGAAREAKFLTEDIKAHEDWIEATKKLSKQDIEVTTEDLAVGDLLEVDGERVEVTHRDEEGTLTLKDGRKFGTQTLSEGKKIYVEKFEAQPEGEAEFLPPEQAAPPTPKPAAPMLRPGEKAGELFQGEDQPFNLAGEKGTDAERLAKERAEADRKAAEKKAFDESRAQDLPGTDLGPTGGAATQIAANEAKIEKLKVEALRAGENRLLNIQAEVERLREENKRLSDLGPTGGIGPGAASAAEFTARENRRRLLGDITERIFGTRAGEVVDALQRKLAGEAVPKTMARSGESGNKMVRFAASNIAGRDLAHAYAVEVLGDKFKDTAFRERLGAVLVEDRLRAIQKGLLDAANEAEGEAQNDLLSQASDVNSLVGRGKPFATERDYQAALRDPDIAAAIERHKQTVQPEALRFHTEAEGQFAGPGVQTGAFVNLLPLFEESPEAVFASARKGDYTRPFKRKSVFSRQAKGTAAKYETDYLPLAERMIQGNYEEYTKRQLYDQLVKDGLAVVQSPGRPRPTFNGQPAEKFQIRRQVTVTRSEEGTKVVPQYENLWVDPAIAPELRQAENLGSPVSNVALAHIANVLNRIQLAGPTDAVWHIANMISTIAGSQGGKTLLADVARKLPLVNVVDAAVRVVSAGKKVLANDPAVMQQIGELSEIGAVRANRPQGWFTSRLINLVDKAGRVVRDDMYKNLVNRGLVEPSEVGRREFVNQLGQYNPRIMGQIESFFKEAGLSPFVVAGRNFNRMALRRLALSPGVRAANLKSAALMRGVEATGVIATLVAVPALINTVLTGSPTGRKGVPFGAIDTGHTDKNGKMVYIDPAQWIGLRRGMRLTGINALVEGLRRGQPTREIAKQAAHDIIGAAVHPWAGPVAQVPFIGATGYTTSFYKESKDPGDYWQNFLAALKNVNPLLHGWFQKQGTGITPGVESAVSTLSSAAGIKTRAPLSAVSQVHDLANSWASSSEDAKTRSQYEQHSKESFSSEYQDLRGALLRNDTKGAREAYQDLRQKGKTPKTIRQTMQHPHPFTGSAAAEAKFKRSLSPEERKTYDQALEERRELYRKFQRMLNTPQQ